MPPTLEIAAFQGLTNTQKYRDLEEPGSFREGILMLDYAGRAPLTALTNLLSSRSVDNKTFHWNTQNPPLRGVDFEAGEVYTDSALTTAYVSGGTKGKTLYIKVSDSAQLKEFGRRDTVILRNEADVTADVAARVNGTEFRDGNVGVMVVTLLEADDNVASGHPAANIATATRLVSRGNAHPDAGMPGDSVTYQSQDMSNQCQIFKKLIKLSGRAQSTRTRTHGAGRNQLKYHRKEKLMLHGEDIEGAFLNGPGGSYEDPDTGELVTLTKGVIPTIREFAPDNYFDFRYDADFAGKTWAQAGRDFFYKVHEHLGLYGDEPHLCFSGLGAFTGLNKLADDNSAYQLQPGATYYGIKVKKFISVHREMELVMHPLLARESATANMIVGLTLKNLGYVYMEGRDTNREDVTPKGFDGVMEQYQTDCGLEMHHPATHFVIDGVGQNNNLTP